LAVKCTAFVLKRAADVVAAIVAIHWASEDPFAARANAVTAQRRAIDTTGVDRFFHVTDPVATTRAIEGTACSRLTRLAGAVAAFRTGTVRGTEGDFVARTNLVPTESATIISARIDVFRSATPAVPTPLLNSAIDRTRGCRFIRGADPITADAAINGTVFYALAITTDPVVAIAAILAAAIGRFPETAEAIPAIGLSAVRRAA
jgi:hypothetical protein